MPNVRVKPAKNAKKASKFQMANALKTATCHANNVPKLTLNHALLVSLDTHLVEIFATQTFPAMIITIVHPAPWVTVYQLENVFHVMLVMIASFVRLPILTNVLFVKEDYI